MDLNKLRYFLVVAETEHVTQAANMLGISQPALTRAIHRLEEELGVTLVAGEGRNIRLTEEGLFLKQHAAQAMRTLDEAEHAMKIFSTQWQQTIEAVSYTHLDRCARWCAHHRRFGALRPRAVLHAFRWRILARIDPYGEGTESFAQSAEDLGRVR